MRDLDGHTGRGALANQISTAVVRVIRGHTGRGPTKARTSVGRDSVTVLLQDTMTRAERILVQAGKADIVFQLRQELQRTMREDLIAAVEALLERKVIAFMSADHIDPEMAAEIFVLEPRVADRKESG